MRFKNIGFLQLEVASPVQAVPRRGWWIPQVEKEAEEENKEDADEKDDKKKEPEEKRGKEDLNALRWFDRE